MSLIKQIVYTNTAKCQDCYRCIRVCPVKAIKMKDGQAYVEDDRCIDCGTCIRECPQKAKTYRNDVEKVREILKTSKKCAVTIAPSFAAVYEEWQQSRLPSALRKLGFVYIAETAVGAFYSAQATAQILSANTQKSFIASACPALVNYITKYTPDLIERLVPVASPMTVHARMLKEKLGDDYSIVFIGPCIAKKDEAEWIENDGLIDAVITFTELDELLELEEINLKNCEESGFDQSPSGDARLFALSGGLAKTASLSSDLLALDIISVTGFDEVKAAFDIASENKRSILVEPLFCSLGCINGPGICSDKNVFDRRASVIEYAKRQSVYTKPSEQITTDMSFEYKSKYILEGLEFSEDEIMQVLDKIGNASPEKEFNCSACGYDTCRDKAVAVLSGMAEIEMCMPYMRRTAELKTDRIIESSPNGIVILDEHFKILHMNPAFRKFFMSSESVSGKPISYLMDPEPFVLLATSDDDIIETTAQHENYGLVCHQIIYRLKEEKQYVGIFVNITKNMADKTQLDELKAQTIQQAQELLNHQISMAQNIAKLLGESTARGEELVENLMKSSQGEKKKDITGNSRQKNWLWDMYTSK